MKSQAPQVQVSRCHSGKGTDCFCPNPNIQYIFLQPIHHSFHQKPQLKRGLQANVTIGLVWSKPPLLMIHQKSS